jgi:hypothetical protein
VVLICDWRASNRTLTSDAITSRLPAPRCLALTGLTLSKNLMKSLAKTQRAHQLVDRS